MELMDRLQRASSEEQSYFRAQLLREDVARLKTLRELTTTTATRESLLKDGLILEWTPGGLRNGELKATLEPLLEAFYAAEKDAPGAVADASVLRAWYEFDAQRMDLLVGCLARVPRPHFD